MASRSVSYSSFAIEHSVLAHEKSSNSDIKYNCDDAESSESIDADALVWNGQVAQDFVLHGDDASITIVTTHIALLRELRAVSGSFVVIKFHGIKHIARLRLVSTVPSTTLPYSIVLPPLLAFNLRIPLHSNGDHQDPLEHSSIHVTLRVAHYHDLGLSIRDNPFRRVCDLTPVNARKAVIAPLLLSSIACRDHAIMKQPDGLLHAIRTYFDRPRVVQAGDVFAISLNETTNVHLSTQTPYSRIVIPQNSTLKAQDDEVIIPPSLPVDTTLLFFRVESLQGPDDADIPIACSVSSLTEVLQTSSVAAPSPDPDRILEYLTVSTNSYCPVPPSSDAIDRLLTILHPSQLCKVPVSVLLSGPQGVGKTTLVYQVARKLGLTVVHCAFTELTAQSELHLLDNLREQVAKAQALGPCVLYISHFFMTDKHDEEAELRFASVFLECLRTLTQIPILACVEDVNDVPKFMRQCFLYEFSVEVPNLKERQTFLESLSRSTVRFHDTSVDLNDVAQRTAGKTYGELSALLTDAAERAIKRLKTGLPLVDQLVHSLLQDETDERTACCITGIDLEQALIHQQARSAATNTGAASIPNVKWEDVGGLEHVKDEILDLIQLPLQNPELFSTGLRQRSGILLYGPPGTGKTLLAKAIATECHINFMSVKGPELLNMYIGESEKNVRQVFARARQCRPCIIFFDELDSLAPMRGRGSDSGGVMDRVVSQLLTEIDALHEEGSVFVIGATNRPDLIESGLLRPGRFDRLLYLGIATDRQAQVKVVKALTRKFHLDADVEIAEIVENCPFVFTGADFYALCSNALAMALKERVETLEKELEEWNRADCYSSGASMTMRMFLNRMSSEELKVVVSQRHFFNALKHVGPSVSAAELQHYERLQAEYNSFVSSIGTIRFHLMVRHSGLQLQVLSLFKAALRVAKQKDVAQGNKTHYTRGINYQFVRERFRDDAFSVPRANFAMIEHLLRKGQRDLKMLERMKSASFTHVAR